MCDVNFQVSMYCQSLLGVTLKFIIQYFSYIYHKQHSTNDDDITIYLSHCVDKSNKINCVPSKDLDQPHGVQNRMILEVNFFLIFEIIIFCLLLLYVT